MGNYRYKAFISYSWADKSWGAWLHRNLELYRTPTALVGLDTRLGRVPRKLAPIFKDREDEPASANIGATIEEALDQSEFLIVVCSPRSSSSQWVNREVAYFKKNCDPDKILCLIVDGEPGASNMPGHEDEECFPKTLIHKIDDSLEPTTELDVLPLAADARKNADGKRIAKLKLAAAMLGVGLDALIQRHERRRKIRLRVGSFATVALASIIVGLSWSTFEARQDAKRLDEDKVRMIIQRVQNSEEPFEEALLSIFEHSTLEAAASELKENCRKTFLTLSGKEKVDFRLRCNLQIGAILFEIKPVEARIYYEEILQYDKNNFDANKRLGRILMMQGEIANSVNALEIALAQAINSNKRPEERLLIRDYLAYTLLHRRLPDEAIAEYERLLAEAQSLNAPILYSRLTTNLGIANLLAGNLDIAREKLDLAIELQQAGNFPDELARTLSAMGRLEEDTERLKGRSRTANADHSPENENNHSKSETQFGLARSYYQRAYDLEVKLGRANGKLDGLLNLARIDLENNLLASARQKYNDALEISESSGFKRGQLYSLAGKVIVAARFEDKQETCKQVESIAKFIEPGMNVSPQVLQIISDFGCKTGSSLKLVEGGR